MYSCKRPRAGPQCLFYFWRGSYHRKPNRAQTRRGKDSRTDLPPNNLLLQEIILYSRTPASRERHEFLLQIPHLIPATSPIMNSLANNSEYIIGQHKYHIQRALPHRDKSNINPSVTAMNHHQLSRVKQCTFITCPFCRAVVQLRLTGLRLWAKQGRCSLETWRKESVPLLFSATKDHLHAMVCRLLLRSCQRLWLT